MKRTLKLGTAIVLFWNAFVFAQSPSTTEKKPEQPTARMARFYILTDTQGVDFGPYLRPVVHDINKNWCSLIPEVARSPVLKKGTVSIEFVITKNGAVAGLHFVSSSGDVMLDRAAYGGITASSPFPPLPKQFYGPYLGLRLTFLYDPLSGISPSHIQVPAGSSVQFSPIMGRNSQPTDPVITWSVHGRGCHGSKCGTISHDGLYTAPLKMPKKPTITVEATATVDEAASAVVTIVPAEPSQSNGQH